MPGTLLDDLEYDGRNETADLRAAAMVVLRVMTVTPADADTYIRGETTSDEVLAELDWPLDDDDEVVDREMAHAYARSLLHRVPEFLRGALELLNG